MTLITCHCLNVKINIKGDFGSGRVVQPSTLTGAQKIDGFFHEGPVEVQLDVLGFSIQHRYLVQSRPVSNWNVFHCYGCKMDSHAVSRVPSDPVLASKHLLASPGQISRLQNSSQFSPVYKIVLKHNETASRVRHPSALVQTGNDPSLNSLLTSVHQEATDFLKDEEEKLEARILRYTEEQQSAFLALQHRVKEDRRALLTILEQKSSETLSEQMHGLSLTASPTKGLPLRTCASVPAYRTKAAEEDLFDFEIDGPAPGSDDAFASTDEDLEYKAGSDRRSIPRSEMGHHAFADYDDMGLAKSLPISVPDMSNLRSYDIDIDDDAAPRNPEEMAASIQALARSVRGSDSYWEVPRPRLNTLH